MQSKSIIFLILCGISSHMYGAAQTTRPSRPKRSVQDAMFLVVSKAITAHKDAQKIIDHHIKNGFIQLAPTSAHYFAFLTLAHDHGKKDIFEYLQSKFNEKNLEDSLEKQNVTLVPTYIGCADDSGFEFFVPRYIAPNAFINGKTLEEMINENKKIKEEKNDLESVSNLARMANYLQAKLEKLPFRITRHVKEEELIEV